MSDNFGYVDCATDRSSACFDTDFFCAAVEEGDAGEDIVHYWFFADQDSIGIVGVFGHGPRHS